MHTLSLHDALPISASCSPAIASWPSTARTSAPSTSSSASSRQIREATSPSRCSATIATWTWRCPSRSGRSEEHTSELQSRPHLVCRLLLEKKNSYGIFDLAEMYSLQLSKYLEQFTVNRDYYETVNIKIKFNNN